MSLYDKLKKAIFPNDEPAKEGFIPQFRLEGRSRDPDNVDNLAMRVADPLWLFGRQWQFGEFQAEDNGSPLQVIAHFRKDRIRHFSFPGDSVYHHRDERVPLEAFVEAIPVEPLDLRSRIRVGQQFERLILEQFDAREAQGLISRLRREFELKEREPWDEKSHRFFLFMKGKVIDGGDLWMAIGNKRFPGEAYPGLADATRRLMLWYEKLFFQPPPGEKGAWHSTQLVHKFKIHLHDQNDPDNLTLSAPDYQNGHLDWFSFDRVDDLKGEGTDQEFQDSPSLSPVNVSFAVSPDKRLFAFEDNKMDLGTMRVDASDLLRIMLIEFSLISGSDWFIVPLEMKLGELCWIRHLEVTDVFGVKTRIENDVDTGIYLSEDPLKVWDVFKIRDDNPAAYDEEEAKKHFLFLAPAATSSLESAPLEELLFLRDEYANMVWAVEKTVANGLGKPVNGYDLHLELNGPFLQDQNLEDSQSPYSKFRLATPVPSNWIPYLPVHVKGSNQEIELRRAMMVRNEDRGEPEPVVPLSWLAKNDLKVVREEAVPRAGVRVLLTRQRLRWVDGNTYVWLGRKVLTGRGEGSSGLRFDVLK